LRCVSVCFSESVIEDRASYHEFEGIDACGCMLEIKSVHLGVFFFLVAQTS
jgi:hypothetical protein